MDNQQIIQHLLNHPESPVDPDWVMSMLKLYPTFFLPAALLISRNPDAVDEETLQKLKAEVILNCSDRTALADIVGLTEADWSNFYPTESPIEATTEQTIDDFIETYGHASTAKEDALLERIIFNPVPADYFADTDQPFDPNDPLALPPELAPKEESQLQKEDASESSDSKSKPQDTDHSDEDKKIAIQAPNSADDSLLMESLAKIFIKQHRYERAYEIISKLSLKFPEKSVYFADQKRFLQKLIINQQFLKSKS